MHFFGDVHFEWRTHWEEALRETRPVQKELVIMRCGFIMPHQSLSANRRLFPLRLWKSKQFTQTTRKSLQYTIQKHNIFFLPNNKETSCRDFFLSPFFLSETVGSRRRPYDSHVCVEICLQQTSAGSGLKTISRYQFLHSIRSLSLQTLLPREIYIWDSREAWLFFVA